MRNHEVIIKKRMMPSQGSIRYRKSSNDKMICVSCFSVVLLVFLQNVDHFNGLELKLGVIADTERVSSWQSLLNQGSAINIAYDALVRDGVLPENVTFRIITRHARREKDGLGATAELVRGGLTDVIVGAPKSTVTEIMAYLTSYWNFPHITWAGQSFELANKRLFTTLVRSSGSITDAVYAMVYMFQQFGWKNLAIFNFDDGICRFGASAILEIFPNFNLSIRQNIAHPESLLLTREQMIEYINLLKQNSRVIYICSETDEDDDEPSIRAILIEFCRQGMCQGSYIFIYADKEPLGPEYFFYGDDDDLIVQEGLKYLFMFSIARYFGEEGKARLEQFNIDVIERMADMPWNSTEAKEAGEVPGEDSQFLYDAIYLYGLWVNSTLDRENRSTLLRDGEAFAEFSKTASFEGIASPCVMGENADRIPDFRVDQYHEDRNMYLAATIRTKFKVVHFEDGLVWYTEDGKPIKDVPECGFANDQCTAEPNESRIDSGLLVSSIAIVVVLGLVGSGFLIRKRQIDRVMLESIWKINVNDVELQKSKVTMKSGLSQGSMSGASSVTSLTCRIDATLTSVGMFKGHRVVIKNLPNSSINLTNEDKRILKVMREMQHDNVNSFVGACFETATPCAVFQYCPKGALQDILENEDIQLDTTFKYSLTYDLVQGICFIHESKLGAHGRLKSTNCVVDNRWVLKITDYGINRFTHRRDAVKLDGENDRFKSLLWTAPELLNIDDKPYHGTKPGDVYSFGIILHEIFYRQGPFAGMSKMTFKDIVTQVRNRLSPPCRPTIFEDHGETDDILPVIIKLMQLCWVDKEEERPTIQVVRTYVKKNVKEIGKNIMDIVLKRLEKYASNLEYLVEQRTQELYLEQQKTDKLLYRMLPRSCADKLKLGEAVYPEVFDSATVYFSDIVGFTVLSAKSTPMQVVDLLNDLYTCFDNVIDKYDAYKVETIGDAYLVVSGVPKRNGKRHAGEIADMSLDIREEVRNFKIEHLPGESLRARIGIHTGPCCAGVVGLSMPRYCLFGDTINTASRMESHGESMKIHISESTYEALQQLDGFLMSFRGEIEIKGKGVMRTYWLNGKDT